MKKLISLLAAMAMVLSLCACGNTAEAPAESAEATEGAVMPAIAKEDIKVGVVHITDPAEGSGYTYTHDLGIQGMQKNLGLDDTQIVRKNNVNDSDATAIENAIRECIEEGCNIVFATSWGYMDTCEALAEEFPEVIISHGTGYKSNGSNFNNYFGRIYQARYLAGIAAGMKTQSNKIGYVAAMGSENSEVTGGVNAFAMGIKSVNPDAVVYVKVTNSWFDPTAEQQAAEALLSMGCDVIGQHCDTTAPQLAAEAKGVWGCGYNSDMTKDAPKAHLTAPIWNWGVYYTKATKAAMEGTWKAENYFGGMDDGLVDISPLSENCAEGTQEAIDAVREKIKSGEFKVFQDEIKDNKGNIVCKAGEVISDADITGNMTWYFENIEVK